MINHFSTKEHKRRFVKNKRGTECYLQGCQACLLNNVFLKCMPRQKPSTCKWRKMERKSSGQNTQCIRTNVSEIDLSSTLLLHPPLQENACFVQYPPSTKQPGTTGELYVILPPTSARFVSSFYEGASDINLAKRSESLLWEVLEKVSSLLKKRPKDKITS